MHGYAIFGLTSYRLRVGWIAFLRNAPVGDSQVNVARRFFKSLLHFGSPYIGLIRSATMHVFKSTPGLYSPRKTIDFEGGEKSPGIILKPVKRCFSARVSNLVFSVQFFKVNVGNSVQLFGDQLKIHCNSWSGTLSFHN